jgi:ADP-heptose:LPS heptosyltransferase
MHIAVAVQAPVVALFGPANPVRTGPYSKEAIVLRKALHCSPCFARSACPLGHAIPPCMGDITVDEVVQAVEQQLEHDIGSSNLRKTA